MLKFSIIFMILISPALTHKNYTTSVATSTTSVKTHGCALWTRYNNDDSPSFNGFSAGISAMSNTTLYVGRGMYEGNRMAARIQITPSTSGPSPRTAGGYVMRKSELNTPYVEYLVVPDSCSCQWLSPSLASNRGMIFVGDAKNGFAIGRKIFEDGKVGLTNVITFTKKSDYMQQLYNPPIGFEIANETAQELLVCDTTASTSGRPKITFNTESCGMWSTIGMVNSAARNGFAAGLSFANNTAYIGRVQRTTQFIFGRYQVESPAGTYYDTYDPKKDFGSEWLIVPENCTCRWMHPDQAKIRKGLITAPDQYKNFMVGRKTFSSGKVSIMSVNNVYGNGLNVNMGWYTNEDKTESNEYATEVLVCETLPLPPCALWTRYNEDDAPSVNGFSAGISIISNTTAYVGMGMYGKWRQPARIQITPESLVGGYTVWSKEVKVNFPEYLVVPDGCTCSWIEPSIAKNRAIILTGDPEVGFAVARKKFEDGRVAISKVITFTNHPDYMKQWYNPTSNTEVTNETATELLVCETIDSTASRPTVKLPSESCGMWSTIGMIDSANKNGLSAGQSIVNNTAFIGRGQKVDRFIPGRFQDKDVVGTYASYNSNETLVDYGSQWLVVPKNCFCCWISINQTRNQKDLVTVPDQLHNFMIGRKTFTNGLVSISRVNNDHESRNNFTLEWFANLIKTEESGNATEILVCETLAPISKACALWTRYNNDDAPSINGFSAGISIISNTTIYVGMGMKGNERMPARIQIINSAEGKEVIMPGGYVSLENEERVSYADYLVVPDDCKCSWMTIETALKRAIILTGDPFHHWAVGRKIFTSGLIALTKVSMNAMSQCFNPTRSTSVCNEPATELLVCEYSSSSKSDQDVTQKRPKINFSTESCGMWSTIGMVDSAETNSFSAGQSIVKNAAFVGRGQKGNRFFPGRYQVTNEIGTYVNIKEIEELADYGSQWLIVPENCTCKWMHPDQAKIRKSLVTVPDWTFNYMVGRKKFSNGLVSIMSVNNVYGLTDAVTLGWYSHENKTRGEGFANEVLVCENLQNLGNACAMWTRYNGDDAPSINGFGAGISFISNKKLYVGMGMYSDSALPARIEVSTSGGYALHNSEVHVENVEYLVVPNGCSCSWMTPSIASNRPGLIFTGNAFLRWVIGRKTFKDGRVGLTRVSTSAKSASYMLQCYNPTSDTTDCSEQADELLVCESLSTANPPLVNLTAESCGMWSTIGMVDPAKTNGFSVGQNITNNIDYIGRGQKDDQMVVGKYRVGNSTGTYVNVSGTEELVDYGSQWLIIPQHCSCHWIALNQVKNKQKIITIPDELHSIMIGRKILSNGIISIFKVDSTTNNSTEIFTCTKTNEN